MKQFFITVFNTLVRDLSPALKATLAVVFYLLAVMALYLSIRKKNDKHPIAWGWMVLCIVSVAIAVVYSIF